MWGTNGRCINLYILMLYGVCLSVCLSLYSELLLFFLFSRPFCNKASIPFWIRKDVERARQVLDDSTGNGENHLQCATSWEEGLLQYSLISTFAMLVVGQSRMYISEGFHQRIPHDFLRKNNKKNGSSNLCGKYTESSVRWTLDWWYLKLSIANTGSSSPFGSPANESFTYGLRKKKRKRTWNLGLDDKDVPQKCFRHCHDTQVHRQDTTGHFCNQPDHPWSCSSNVESHR